MPIDPTIWSKLHGAATHFPIALVIVSAFCDGVAFIPANPERQRGLRFVAVITIILGALGSLGAAATGLVTSRWQVWGHGALLRHHLFVWPAFALITILGAWRLIDSREEILRPTGVYLSLMLLAVAAMTGAGYWGGELLNHG